MIQIEITVIDLQRNDTGGWMANGCSVDRTTISVPESLSDREIARRIKSAAGITGWPRDEWSGAEWSWRNGTIGAYADVII